MSFIINKNSTNNNPFCATGIICGATGILALVLLDAAMSGGRKLALIHFAAMDKFKTDLFMPGQYDTSDVLKAAETFLDGGTNFVTPLKEAIRLIEHEGFENADIVFVNDGECALLETFQETLNRKQTARGFSVTGVLLDNASPGMAFSIKPFCDDIYRTSELSQESIVESVLQKRI